MSDFHKAILNRSDAVEAAKSYRDSVDLLNELLDYGSDLLPRAFVDRCNEVTANCIRVQFRQFLVHLDGAAVIAAAGNCFTASLQLRSLLEIEIIIEWLLAADTDSKSQYLFTANLRQSRRWCEMFLSQFSGSSDALGHSTPTAEPPCELTREKRAIDAFLAKPPYAEIDSKFQQRNGTREQDLPWYEVYGMQFGSKNTIRKICEELGVLNSYYKIYCVLSQITHGSDLGENILVGFRDANPIREVEEIPMVASLAASLSLRLYRLIIRTYCTNETERFEQKYLRDWEPRIVREYEILSVSLEIPF
jgi:hypothetical protein